MDTYVTVGSLIVVWYFFGRLLGGRQRFRAWLHKVSAPTEPSPVHNDEAAGVFAFPNEQETRALLREGRLKEAADLLDRSLEPTPSRTGPGLSLGGQQMRGLSEIASRSKSDRPGGES